MATTFEPIAKISRDLIKAAGTMGINEVRVAVDLYYQIQEFRKASGNQALAASKEGKPKDFLDWTFNTMYTVEETIVRALDVYSKSTELGKWCRSICGIGPVITAGLLANIDISKAPTVGHIWRFAGLDPTVVWEKNQRRPWNAQLKCLCWKIGESFVKTSGNPRDFYGKIWLKRKAEEWERNKRGEYSAQCDAALAKLRPGGDQEARYWYEGRLSPEAVFKDEGQGGKAPGVE